MPSVILKPLLTNIIRIIRTLPTVPMAYQWLTKCLRKSTANYRLHNVRWMYGSASYCCSHRMANVLANMNIWTAPRIRPKWRLDSEIVISVSPLDRPRSALSLPIYHEDITNAYQRLSLPLRMLPKLTHALPTLPMLTKITPNDRLRNIRWN